MNRRIAGIAVGICWLVTASISQAAVEATVNGKEITTADVDAAFTRTAVSRQPLTDDQRRMYRSHVLNVLVDNMLLKQYLDSEKITPDPTAVANHIEQFKAAVAQQGQTIESFLAANNITQEQMQQEIRDLYQWFAEVEKQATDKNLHEYFEANKSAFDGSQIRVSHILVEYPPTATPEEKNAALKKIQQIKTQLAAGTDFASLAKQYSDCQSKDQGGDVGFFPRKGKMTEPFARAAFELKRGEVSDIVETEYGYHLIKMTERKEGTPVRYATVAEDVKQLFAADLRAAIIDAMRKQAKIQINRPTATAASPAGAPVR